jgi:maleamate amidohydrolase
MPGKDDVAANYATVFDGHLAFGRQPAVLVVDMVMAYFDTRSPLYAGVDDVLASNRRLVSAARSAGLPVVFTSVVYEPGGGDGGLFYLKIPALKVFDKGSPFGGFPVGLQPRSDELVVTKQYASAFFGTSLAQHFAALGIDSLLITGVSTSGCVRATALDALQYGFAPFVVRDACGDRHPAPHEANLFDLQAKYAEVISEERALRLIRGKTD